MDLRVELEKVVKEQKEIILGVKTNGYEQLRYLKISELQCAGDNIYIKEENDSETIICIPNGIYYDEVAQFWKIPIDKGEVCISIIE